MTDLTGNFSGVVLNQNVSPTGTYDWRDTFSGNWVYQTFTLPSNYVRGVGDYIQIPDLSGFQVYVNIDSGYAVSASINYVVQYYSSGWVTLTSGTQIGCHTDGNCWFDIIFGQSIPVSELLLTEQFRIGIKVPSVTDQALEVPVTTNSTSGQYVINGVGYTANLIAGIPFPITVGPYAAFLLKAIDGSISYSVQQGVNSLGYVEPTPLADNDASRGQAYQADGITPLLGGATTASLDFRVLALTADTGTDFLGNEYRSAVVNASVANTDTTGTNVGSTANNYYMSAPQPSRFAVIPTYWDVRPQATSPTYGVANVVLNPSMEYDKLGASAAGWTHVGGATPTLAVSSTWSSSGEQSLKVTGTSTATNQSNGAQVATHASVIGGQSYSVSAVVNVVDANADGVYIQFSWLDNTGTSIATTNSPFVTGTGVTTLSFTTTAPPNIGVVGLAIAIYSKAAASSEPILFYIDSVCCTATETVYPYFDGDSVGYEWTGQRGDSPSVQVIAPSVQDNSIVVDSVMVDPLTPNMAFNVYYSIDDTGTSDKMSEADWENKLWYRVPQSFQCSSKQTYALPEPIIAKYVCVEFTNLQSQSYDPGPFQQPVSYKKFPTWVANFFINEMESPAFVADQVNVQYDALDFAYNYYLDDLDQEPASPVAAPIGAAAQLTTYFNSTTDTQGLDATTLAQINLVMNLYTIPSTQNVDSNSILGQYVQTIAASPSAPNDTIENSIVVPIDYSTVSSLAREPVVFENTLPVMFFFVTCRHGYKELSAPFEYNRAYFAGINDIAFIRNDYTIESDTALYIESGGDMQNAVLNDWQLDVDSNWYTYDND